MTNPGCRHLHAGSRDGSTRMRAPWRRIVRAAAGLGVAVVGAGLPACSTDSDVPAAAPSSTSAPVSPTTVMIDGDKHTLLSPVDCATKLAQRDATPPESGDLTTRVNVHDDKASVRLALSDLKPPTVDGFAISLKVGNGQYRIPYQAPQSAIQVQATKEGKSYTVTGTAQASTPGQSGMRQVTFGIHVTCP